MEKKKKNGVLKINKGIGKFMINQIMNEEPTAFAKVKMDNEASIKLFEACGFTKKFYILTKD